MLKSELDVHAGLAEGYTWLADLGYLGMTHDYDLPAHSLPHRKPRRSKENPDTCLTDEQRLQNQQHASQRVKVEHALTGAKRLGAIAQICRNKAPSFVDRLLAVACGIWNWFIRQAPLRI